MVRKPARRRKVLEGSSEYGQELAATIHALAANSMDKQGKQSC
jgi:hypothetical protein